MPLTRGQKRTLARLGEPVLRVLFGVSRLASLDFWSPLPVSPRRILVVRLDSIGDVLLSEPAISALRRRFPKARLDVVAGAAGRAVLQGHPAVDNLIYYEAPWHAAWRSQGVSWSREARPLLRTLARLRRRKYDLVCELRGDFRDIAFAAFCGAKVRAGSGERGGGSFLTLDVRRGPTAHHAEKALAVVEACGASGVLEMPQLHLTDIEREMAVTVLPDGRTYAAFHLGAGFSSKCLPVDCFVEAARAVASRGAVPLLVGGAGDAALAALFKAGYNGDVVDLVGRLTVRETAAVLGRCALFTGNDSGPMHLAAAAGTPVVAAFGPSDPQTYRPLGVPYRIIQLEIPCRPCDLVNCSQGENICMTGIKGEQMAEACLEMLSARSGADRRA